MNKDLISILLVDDFEMIRVVVHRVLAELGYRDVRQARGGREALALIEAAAATDRPLDLVLCDWAMPDFDGMQVLRAVRENPLTQPLPFVMLTAEADQKSMVRAMKAGASDYIVKPVNPVTIGEKIERVLTKHRRPAA